MKKIITYCLLMIGIGSFAPLAVAQQKDAAKPTTVVFRGIYKFPELEFYTIIAGKKTPIKESSILSIDPWTTLVVRAVYTRTETIVGRGKILYATIPTEIILSDIKEETIHYIRKSLTTNAVASEQTKIGATLTKVPSTPTYNAPATAVVASKPKAKPKSVISKESTRSQAVPLPTVPKKVIEPPVMKSTEIQTKLVSETSAPKTEEPLLAGTLIPRREEQTIVKTVAKPKAKVKPMVVKSTSKRGQSIVLTPIVTQQ